MNIYEVKRASPGVFYEMLMQKFYHMNFFFKNWKTKRTVQNQSLVQNQTSSSYRLETLLGDR
jgi:hypothetical protein